MNLLSVSNLSKSYGDKVLFSDISFGISKGDKIALIATNGSGKTTLLNVLTNKDYADMGEFVYRDGIRVSYLKQEPGFDDDSTINEIINHSKTEQAQIVNRYQQALEKHAKEESDESKLELDKSLALMDTNQAWDYQTRISNLLSLFKIENLEIKAGELSGGQRKRLALAMVLLDKPDMLILDEPTNHLDIGMIEWLEKELGNSTMSLLMVTHDRIFLDNVCNTIIELENGELFIYKGNYSYFLEKKAERDEILEIETDKAKKLYKKELEWLRRMPKARTHKSKSRMDAIGNIKKKAENKKVTKNIELDIRAKRLGGKILEIENMSGSFESFQVAKNFNYIFKKGERVGFIGNNGSGKTSFLNLLSGDLKPDSGSISLGANTSIGYYRQGGIEIEKGRKIINIVKDIAEVIYAGNGNTYTASQFLDHFMFPPKMQQSQIENLSGGEKRRLYLLTVLIKNPNFLILDEPTNDLDLVTLNKLEEFLLSYKGCLIVVSHDRYFLNKLVDHYFIFDGKGNIKDCYGNLFEYLENKKLQEKNSRKSIKKNSDKKKNIKPAQEKKKKLSFKEKREYNLLEEEIAKLEREKSELEAKLNDATIEYLELHRITTRISELLELIDAKTLRWMELDDIAD